MDCMAGRFPVGTPTEVTLPRDVVHIETRPAAGFLDDDGNQCFLADFVLRYDGYHQTMTVAYTAKDSRSQVEDNVAAAMERFVKYVIVERQKKEGRHVATKAERVELAAVLRDVRAYRKRKLEGRGKILFVPRA